MLVARSYAVISTECISEVVQVQAGGTVPPFREGSIPPKRSSRMLSCMSNASHCDFRPFVPIAEARCSILDLGVAFSKAAGGA